MKAKRIERIKRRVQKRLQRLTTPSTGKVNLGIPMIAFLMNLATKVRFGSSILFSIGGLFLITLIVTLIVVAALWVMQHYTGNSIGDPDKAVHIAMAILT